MEYETLYMKENNGNYIGSTNAANIKNQPSHAIGNILSKDGNETHRIEQRPKLGSFTINFMKQEEGSKLFIYDSHGNHIIKSMSLNQGLKEVNLNNQPKGVYFIKIVHGNKKNISKVVIQ